MRIAIASDHAGFELKAVLATHLLAGHHEVTDLGTDSTESVDYPDYGEAVGRAVADGRAEFGVGVCGSGIGICMAAGKVPGVRAATVHDVTSARLSRAHNDANVMCVGARFTGPQVALDALDAFLAADFDGGRHTGRVAKIDAIS
ncbi:MAG: ribose 5-phosphate isomerase B [Actinomycetota bacterium]